ncbi:MAG TPA: 4-hydroxy-3-methylbut-2-enyl diphosphate reductase [Nocardioides sp.]|jgi:4-hydroxy-3-methylbut-2-enyl diphosphate reductase|uniref:4-hydroxy-3-methylbut-2-enyl diphosphate reductase n=1 Tax=Nocardioides sp. TaxID=35761 RepID=UPI002E369F72|nr:4-hydroxy-3-methylbut-2-enyl diphosphate reductase [Nocardioides sp.]HEX3930866.1 4-hydroxy-3-methylbut-2-enyl diphosphate reductase [Nocardioides sp.]
MRPTVCVPLRSEWLALRDRIDPELVEVVRTGRATGEPRPGPVLVAGVAGALVSGIEPGDLVVANEVRRGDTVVTCPVAPLLAGALRRRGLRVHLGPVVTVDHVVHDPAERESLAATGAIAVDTESALLLSRDGSDAVVRAVVDAPDRLLLRPGMPLRGVKALAALRAAAPVIEQWAGAVGERVILLAGPRSFCAGVERAIEIVERALDRFGAPVYVRRQIVHNRHVVADLQARGAVFVEEAEEVPEGSVLVLAAHGVAPAVRRTAEQRGLQVIDATCPLVSKVHQEVRRFAARDSTVLLIGHHDHEEVVGTRGEAPDRVLVVADAREAETVEVPDPQRLAYAMQTTLAQDEAAETVQVLRRRFPAIEGPHSDDICYATTNRQHAVSRVAREADLVIVIGSQNSSNSLRLVEVCETLGTPARLVDDASDVDLDLLAGVRRVGITAGASAPPVLVEALVAALSGLGRTVVCELGDTTEDVAFLLPKEVTTA